MRRPPAETIPALSDRIGPLPVRSRTPRLPRLGVRTRSEVRRRRGRTGRSTPYYPPTNLRAMSHWPTTTTAASNPDPEYAALSVAANETNPISERLTAPTSQRSWDAIRAYGRPPHVARALPAPGKSANPAESFVTRQFFRLSCREQAVYGSRTAPGGLPGPLPGRHRLPRPGPRPTSLPPMAPRTGARRLRPRLPPALAHRAQPQLLPIARRHAQSAPVPGGCPRRRCRPAEDILPAARLFYYWRQQGNVDAARRALLEYTQRKTQWTPEELTVTARLFQGVNSHDDAAHACTASIPCPAPPPTPAAMPWPNWPACCSPPRTSPFASAPATSPSTATSPPPTPTPVSSTASFRCSSTPPTRARSSPPRNRPESPTSTAPRPPNSSAAGPAVPCGPAAGQPPRRPHSRLLHLRCKCPGNNEKQAISHRVSEVE